MAYKSSSKNMKRLSFTGLETLVGLTTSKHTQNSKQLIYQRHFTRSLLELNKTLSINTLSVFCQKCCHRFSINFEPLLNKKHKNISPKDVLGVCQCLKCNSRTLSLEIFIDNSFVSMNEDVENLALTDNYIQTSSIGASLIKILSCINDTSDSYSIRHNILIILSELQDGSSQLSKIYPLLNTLRDCYRSDKKKFPKNFIQTLKTIVTIVNLIEEFYTIDIPHDISLTDSNNYISEKIISIKQKIDNAKTNLINEISIHIHPFLNLIEYKIFLETQLNKMINTTLIQ